MEPDSTEIDSSNHPMSRSTKWNFIWKKSGFYIQNWPHKSHFGSERPKLWTFSYMPSTNSCHLTLTRSYFVHFRATGLIYLASGHISIIFWSCYYKHLTLASKIDKNIDKTERYPPFLHNCCQFWSSIL